MAQCREWLCTDIKLAGGPSCLLQCTMWTCVLEAATGHTLPAGGRCCIGQWRYGLSCWCPISLSPQVLVWLHWCQWVHGWLNIRSGVHKYWELWESTPIKPHRKKWDETDKNVIYNSNPSQTLKNMLLFHRQGLTIRFHRVRTNKPFSNGMLTHCSHSQIVRFTNTVIYTQQN